MTSQPTTNTGSTVHQVLARLQPRDRMLTRLLGEHQVLCTDQIHTLLHPSRSTCQHRLARLRTLRLLHTFRGTGTGPAAATRWILAPLGHQLLAAEANQPLSPGKAIEMADRIAASRHLGHQLAVNQFVTDLVAHARTHPDARLASWNTCPPCPEHVNPHGQGAWCRAGRTVAFYLERHTDIDTRWLLGKLSRYDDAHPWCVQPGRLVLILLDHPEHEQELHHMLSFSSLRRPVATTVPTRHGDGPAGPIWRKAGDHHPVTLHQLPGTNVDLGEDWTGPHRLELPPPEHDPDAAAWQQAIAGRPHRAGEAA
jgi:hypothetical protein